MSALPERRSSRPPSKDARLPRRFGPYDLFASVGRGGMAELFLARRETELGATKNCVVKMILPAFADDAKFADMLAHEAKLAATLSHKNIVQVTDLGRAEGRLYIAMEYVEGFDLGALLRLCTQRDVALPPGHALGIVADVLEGLHYAHRQPLGIVHRDISPSNVLISYDGEVKLCDFGIAKAHDLVGDGSVNEALKGKAAYMSPEHARAELVDSRSDVFAAGIILWELLAGHRLYRPKVETSLVQQAQRADVPDLALDHLPHPEELRAIVKRALAVDREERYQTAGAFQRDLEGYLARAGLLASRLKLGEWIASAVGTEMIEDRRESERRLPKSVPPPRSSGVVPASDPSDAFVFVPAAPRIPRELASMTLEPLPSPSEPKPAAASQGRKDTDEELLGWARRRGVLTFFFFLTLAVIIGAIWYFTH